MPLAWTTSTSLVTPRADSLKLRVTVASCARLPNPNPAKSSKMVPKPNPAWPLPAPARLAVRRSPKICLKSSSASMLDCQCQLQKC